jgi:hypothetical protein
MIGTQWMKDSLAARREARDMTKAGWEWIGEGGGKLWELYRGWRTDQHIVDAKVSYSGLGVWVKIEPRSIVVPGVKT